MKHNHITRDIKRRGLCPGCDAYHARRDSMKHLFYKLTPEGPVPCTVEEWENRHGVDTTYRIGHDVVGRVIINTNFTGVNVQNDEGPPQVYATLVTGRHAPDVRREQTYATREEAVEGHRRLVEQIRAESPVNEQPK